ncbi:MAG: hypothetical protein HUU18_10155 [Phycisphaerales bacterium]|nr:hypothetical protein [Phycisphaerales bacterium]
MITPSPTAKIDPSLARGVNAGEAGGTLRFGVPNTNYEIHLVPEQPVTTPEGKRLVGVIRAKARRIDVVSTGGRFIEPVTGRPRRIQGIVIRTDSGGVVVDAGIPIHCATTDPRQSPDQFKPGDLIACDLLAGTSFEMRSA